MKALLLRAVVLARRRKTLAESTRRSHLRRLDHALNAIMVLAPTGEFTGLRWRLQSASSGDYLRPVHMDPQPATE
jgi:transposase